MAIGTKHDKEKGRSSGPGPERWVQSGAATRRVDTLAAPPPPPTVSPPPPASPRDRDPSMARSTTTRAAAAAGGWKRVPARWLARNWRALVSELVSTSMLLGLGCASCLRMPNASRVAAPLVNPALSFGFLVAALSVAFGVPSGAHMNPAVSVAAVLMKRMSPALAVGFVLMQVMGATLGYFLLAALIPAAREHPSGMTLPGDEISELGALGMEVVMTSLLVMTVCAVWVSPPDPTVPIKMGLLVCGLTLAGGWICGTSLNPARSIGPVFYHNYWDHHWVYWAGPLLGAVAGVGLHVMLHPARPQSPQPLAPDESEQLERRGLKERDIQLHEQAQP